MSFSARSPKVLPIIRDPNLAVWQNALTPILKKALPPATPTNFQATNVRGGIQISWSPLQRNDIGKPGPDGYEILRSVDGSFTGDVQIIPVKNAQQTNYFDPFGSATTAHYRIRATAGSASSPQAQRGPESGTVRHTSLDPSDSKSFSTTVRDNFTTDKTASNARFGNYGLDVYQNNPAVNGPASSSSASGGVSVPTQPSGGPPPSSGAVNFSSIIAGTNSGQLMVVGDGSEITTTGTGINDANSMNSIPVNAPAPADQQALTYVAANSDWEPVNLPISEPAVTHNFLTSYTSGTGVFTQAQPAFTDISGTVAPTQLPTPTATTLGGIESLVAVTSKWINTISTSGVPSATQPAFTDISGTAAVGQIPSLPASQITTGQLALARGGTNADLSATGGTHSFLKQVSTGAAITVVQPAFTDISGTATSGQYVAMVGDSGSGGTQGAVPAPAAGTAAAGKFLKADGTWAVPTGTGGSGTVTSVALGADSGAILASSGGPVTTTGTLQLQFSTQAANAVLSGPTTGAAATPTFRALVGADLPNPSASTKGGVESIAAVSHNFLTSISTSGVPAQAQPAFSDISGSATAAQLPSFTRSLNFVIDGGGSVPALGVYGQINMPVAGTITGWILTADASGSAVVDVLRSTYSGFPTTASLASSDKPTLSSVQKNENLAVSVWTTAVAAGDQIQINLNSVTTCKRLNLTIIITTPFA